MHIQAMILPFPKNLKIVQNQEQCVSLNFCVNGATVVTEQKYFSCLKYVFLLRLYLYTN